jgi:acetyltransferase-like isoleucine patch superfamily enzyme
MYILDLIRKFFDQRLFNFYRVLVFLFFGGRFKSWPKFYGSPIVIGYYSKVALGCRVVVNYGVVLNSRDSITIGNDVHLSSFSKIYTGELDIENRSKHNESPVNIGNNVWIGSGAIILGGVDIADGCVIAAGAVVTKSISISGLYAGVPARLIRSFL